MALNRILFPFAFFVLILHLTHSSQAFWSQKTTSHPKYKIKKIHFITKNKVLSLYLEKKTKSYLKKYFSKKRENQILNYLKKELESQKYIFSEIEQKKPTYDHQKKQIQLYYIITKPYRHIFIFEGIKTNSRDLKKLQLTQIDNRNSTWHDVAREIEGKIYTYYTNKGYPHTKISSQINVNEKKFKKELKIKVEKGSRVRITDIHIYGQISRESQYYKNFILKNGFSGKKNPIYVKKKLKEGYEKLLFYLRNQGYLQAKVQVTRLEYSPNNASVQISVLINEGPLSLVESISFQGNNSFSQEILEKAVFIQSQQPLKTSQIDKSIDSIKNFYHRKGYMEMNIDLKKLIQYKNRGALADITFYIHEGPQVRVAEILIKGLEKTKESLVLKILDLKPGDILSNKKIEDAANRLSRLGIFSRVDIDLLETNTPSADKIVVVSLQEQNPGVFRVGLGITEKNGKTLRGYTGISYNNLAGKGRTLLARFTLQKKLSQKHFLENETLVSYLEPFLFPSFLKSVRGRLSLAHSQEVICFRDSKICPESLTGEKSTRISTFLEKDFGEYFKLYWKVWSLDYIRYFQTGSISNKINSEIQKVATIGPSLEANFTDDPLLPSRGTSGKITVDYSDPKLGNSSFIHFIRTEGSVHHYIPLRKLNLALALRGGYLKNISARRDSGVPLKYSFFLGGSSTIRGFSGTTEDRIPSRAEFGTPEERQLVVSDSSYYYLFKSELRFPIYKKIGGVIFYDAGGVAVRGYTFLQPLRQGYGIGLRLNTPVGPLSLDYARKVRQIHFPQEQQPEPAYHLHFSIGTF